MVDVSKVKFRLNKAHGCIASAEADINLGHLYSAANRSYYAVYNAMRANLELLNFESKKHTGNIGEFRKMFIKTGIYDASLSDIIRDSFELREACDYEYHFIATLSDVTQQLKNAKHFFDVVNQHIKNTLAGLSKDCACG